MKLPSESELRRSDADTLAAGKIVRARPSWDSLKSELGSALTVTENADGTVNGRVVDHTPEKRYLKRLHAMGRESKRLECDLGAEIQSRTPMVALKDGRGLDYVREDMADRVARKRNLRPVIKWGRPRERTVVGTDGLFTVYRRDAGGTMRLWRAYRLDSRGDEVAVKVNA